MAWTQRFLTLPKTLDLKSMVPERLSKHWEEAAYLVHCVYGKSIHDSRYASRNRFVFLSNDLLRKVVNGNRLAAWMVWLKDAGIIEIEPSYRAGFYSRSYRMDLRFRYERPMRHAVINKKLNGKISDFRNGRMAGYDNPTLRSLRSSLKELSIDYEAAMEHISRKDYSDCKVPEDAYDSDWDAIEAISVRDFYFSEDHYGRVHTNLTNLSSDLRQFLRWRDQRLWNTDIRNSQPFVFGCLLMSLFKLTDSVSCDGVRELIHKIERYSVIGKYQEKRSDSEQAISTTAIAEKLSSAAPASAARPGGERKGPTPSIMSHDFDFFEYNSFEDMDFGQEKMNFKAVELRLPESSESDVLQVVRFARHHWKECNRYIRLCCEGQLYEYFQNLLPEDSRYRRMERVEFKQTFFRECIFCKSETAPDRLFRDLFVREFPHVWKIICALKRSHHSVLPKLLQNIESQYVIHKASVAFLKGRPKRFLGTIHDSLLVTESDARFAEQCLVDCFRESGLFPTVAVVPA